MDVRQRVRVVAVVAVLVAAGAGAWWAGAVEPRFGPGGGSEYGAREGTISYGFPVRNDGVLPVTILGAGRSGPGLELTSVEGDFPVTLRRGEQTTITVTYRVTDCDAVPSTPWPVPVTVERLWGSRTVAVALPAQRQRDWHDVVLPVRRSGDVQWQRMQADIACAPAA